MYKKKKTIVAGVFRLFFGLKLNPYRVSSYMRKFRLPHITFKPSFNVKETAVIYGKRIQANLHTISCRSLLVHHKVKSIGFIKTKVFTQFPYFRKNRKETMAKLLYTKLLLVTIIHAEFAAVFHLPLRSCVYIYRIFRALHSFRILNRREIFAWQTRAIKYACAY